MSQCPATIFKGELTMGENIADLGGLLIALDAYHASLKGHVPPVLDGVAGDQRVFLAWAQVWRQKTRTDAIIEETKSDPHSPAQFRVSSARRATTTAGTKHSTSNRAKLITWLQVNGCVFRKTDLLVANVTRLSLSLALVQGQPLISFRVFLRKLRWMFVMFCRMHKVPVSHF